MATNLKLNEKVVLAKALPQLAKCAIKDIAHLEEDNNYILMTDFNGLSLKEKKLVTSEKTYKFKEMTGEIAVSDTVYFDCITRDTRLKSNIAVFMNGDEDIHCVGVREFNRWGLTSIRNVIVPITIIPHGDYDKIIADVTSAMTAEVEATRGAADTKAPETDTKTKAVKKTATKKKAVKKTATKTKAVTDEATA